METLLSQAEQMPGLWAASRSPAVRGWDEATLSRALGWSRAFQRLHSRLRDAEPGLREAVERRLRRRGPQVGLGHLRRCPALLSSALLENRALPPAARRLLLRSLLPPSEGGGEEEEEELSLPLSARRKAAAQLLPAREGPADRAQAQLLLSRLREGSPASSDGGGGVALLEQLPRGPTLYKAVASALLEPGAESEARTALLPWLLREGGGARLEAFCRLLPPARVASLCSRHPPLRGPYLRLLAAWGGRLAYDPLRGQWRSREVAWEELRERLRRLSREPEPLGSAAREEIRKLKVEDGGFEAPGLSVWTDLLLDLERPDLEEEKPGRDQSQFVMETWGEKDL